MQSENTEQQAARRNARDDDQLDQFVRIGRVKERHNCSRSTIVRWMADPRIAFPKPVMRDGRRVLWSMREIVEWQELQRQRRDEREKKS